MGTAPLDHDLENVLRRHQPAGARGEAADGQARPVVQAVDLTEREAFEQPVLEHGQGTSPPLLGGLEEEAEGAVEAPLGGEDLRRAEQHGGVAVVAAGVHQPGAPGAVGAVPQLLDAERVHVGAERDRASGGAAAQRADDADPTDPLDDLVEPETPELVGDERGGSRQLEPELGVGVEVVPPGRHLGGDGRKRGAHASSPGGSGPSVATSRTRLLPSRPSSSAGCDPGGTARRPARPAAPDGVVAGPPHAASVVAASASAVSPTVIAVAPWRSRTFTAGAEATPQESISAEVPRSPGTRTTRPASSAAATQAARSGSTTTIRPSLAIRPRTPSARAAASPPTPACTNRCVGRSSPITRSCSTISWAISP